MLEWVFGILGGLISGRKKKLREDQNLLKTTPFTRVYMYMPPTKKCAALVSIIFILIYHGNQETESLVVIDVRNTSLIKQWSRLQVSTS